MTGGHDPDKRSGWVLALASLGWALAGALGWSFFDARSLSSEVGVGQMEAWAAAALAGTKVALVLCPIGFSVGWLWHRTGIGRRFREALAERPAQVGAQWVCMGLAWNVMSYATYGSMLLFRRAFASEHVHQLALSISAPLFAIAGLCLSWVIYGPLGSLLGRFRSRIAVVSTAVFLTLLLFIVWVVGLVVLGFDIWRNLVPHIYLSVPIIGLCAVVGSMLAGFRRVRLFVCGLGFLVLPLVAMANLSEPSKSLRLGLAFRDTGTGFINRMTTSSNASHFAASATNRGRSAVCGPGIESPQLSDVGRAGARAPDVIWLTVDALRWDHTSLANYERDTTPAIARYAKQAAVFEQAYTPSSITRQTMPALFTGVLPSMLEPPRGQRFVMTIADEQHTLAEFMQTAGYKTIALSSDAYIFAKAHGSLQGFQIVDESYYALKKRRGYTVPEIVDRVIEELDQGSEPKFVWTHLLESHDPFAGGPDPVDFGSEEADLYDASLRFIDSEVERLLEFVASRQSERPTYLVITADHGEAFGERGHLRHGKSVFQEEVHVPLIIWGPDVVPGSYQRPVGVLDLFPTTFELAGLQVPRGHCGQSLATTLRDGREPASRPVFTELIPDGSRTYFSVGFVNGRDRVVIEPKIDATLLFSLDDDPAEENDLAEAEPDRLARHLAVFRAFMQERGMAPSDYGLK